MRMNELGGGVFLSLMAKYEDLPMDFCDASLVYLASHLKIHRPQMLQVARVGHARQLGTRGSTLVETIFG